MNDAVLYLDLAGIRLKIQHGGAFSGNLSILEQYLAEPGPVSHVCRTEIVDSIPIPDAPPVYNCGGQLVFCEADQVSRYFMEAADAYIGISRRGNDRLIRYRASHLYQGITAKLLLSALELEHLLTIHDGLLLHASFIAHDGKAILFTAPSETGKSTQARLWCEHLGAELINGDRAAVRIFDDGVKACGIPFSGSSPVRTNRKLPLAAIVYLSQGQENTITRLRGARAFRRVWEGCTVNVWDRKDVELATRTVTEVVSHVPVYHLACTPDERAVQLLKRTMEVDS